jgi:hypothetical protein
MASWMLAIVLIHKTDRWDRPRGRISYLKVLARFFFDIFFTSVTTSRDIRTTTQMVGQDRQSKDFDHRDNLVKMICSNLTRELIFVECLNTYVNYKLPNC